MAEPPFNADFSLLDWHDDGRNFATQRSDHSYTVAFINCTMPLEAFENLTLQLLKGTKHRKL